MTDSLEKSQITSFIKRNDELENEIKETKKMFLDSIRNDVLQSLPCDKRDSARELINSIDKKETLDGLKSIFDSISFDVPKTPPPPQNQNEEEKEEGYAYNWTGGEAP